MMSRKTPLTEDLLVVTQSSLTVPAPLFAQPGARKRVLEFFTTQIHNDHTRRAYVQANENVLGLV